jgi:hypothetical protein
MAGNLETLSQSANLRRTDRERRRWGIGVWLLVGAALAVTECVAAAGNSWPTLSATVGHLEMLWAPAKIIVVTLIVFAVAHAFRFPPHLRREYRRDASQGPAQTARWGRTAGGRLMRIPAGEMLDDFDADDTRELKNPVLYVVVTTAVVIAAIVAAFVLSSDTHMRGYVIWGLLAVALLIIPNALAWLRAKEVPFPTLARTIDLLGKWRHPIELIICAGLVVLAIHLVAYPWP